MLASGEVNLWTYSKWQEYIHLSKMEYLMKITEKPQTNLDIYPSSPLSAEEIKETCPILIYLMTFSLTQLLNDLSKPQSTSLSLRHQITQE
jgi:hypothetical protein